MKEIEVMRLKGSIVFMLPPVTQVVEGRTPDEQERSFREVMWRFLVPGEDGS